ncbi:hypothetical protein JXI42_00695 [bacterium]|nr:hypothetical protein [bacterium]
MEEQAKCPSCGRFIGAHTTCPYCGTHIKQRLSIRLLKIFALSFSIIGVIILFIVSRQTEVRLVPIGEISTTMNFAFLRIKGVVIDVPRVNAADHYVSFDLSDPTGVMSVRAYSATADAMIGESKIPMLGDTVDVAGTVRIKAENPGILVNLPKMVKITSPAPLPMEIASITKGNMNEVVTIQGEVSGIKDYDNLANLTLSSPKAEGSIDLVLYKGTYEGDIPPIAEKDKIKVTGMVSEYRDKLQVIPRSLTEIEFIDKLESSHRVEISQPPPFVPLKDLSWDFHDKVIIIEGKITYVRDFGKGKELTLKQGDHYAAVVIWKDTFEEIPGNQNIKVGESIKVTGKLGDYKGKLQLVPRDAVDVVFVE